VDVVGAVAEGMKDGRMTGAEIQTVITEAGDIVEDIGQAQQAFIETNDALKKTVDVDPAPANEMAVDGVADADAKAAKPKKQKKKAKKAASKKNVKKASGSGSGSSPAPAPAAEAAPAPSADGKAEAKEADTPAPPNN
jgi:hypothetical protein